VRNDMARYVGIKRNRILLISDKPCLDEGFQTLEVPASLAHISHADIITKCKISNGQIKCRQLKKPAKDIKLALVGNWKMRCGIATYSENLWGEVVKHVGDFKLFIEKNDLTTGNVHQVGDQIVSSDKVLSCWKRGDPLQPLIDALKEYDPDVIWIQHEFGLWPNASYWLSMMSQLSEYRVIVTMHSVFHHRDKTIVEAAMPEIITHLQGGQNVLKIEKEISGKVHVLPHGCYPYSPEKLWNFYKSDRTFVQFGFGFRYKGWENSIRAAAILKEKYPDVFFTGLFSESPFNKSEHQLYYNDLMDLVDQLGVKENVAILRGYQSDATLDSFMRTNQATIFPYVSHPAHEVYGASGAARVAMSKGLPVVTSSVNHFSDLPTLKADTAEELAAALDSMFSDPVARRVQIEKQLSYVNENTWEKIALRHIAIFEE
jgi:glycosyltransferase involved in cell wall biosynthesis